MKPTTKSAGGTSFHNTTFKATPNQLMELLGKPYNYYNNGSDKVNIDWTMETETGDVFTVYDWKYYQPLDMDTIYEWHIGGMSRNITEIALQEIQEKLKSKVQI